MSTYFPLFLVQKEAYQIMIPHWACALLHLIFVFLKYILDTMSYQFMEVFFAFCGCIVCGCVAVRMWIISSMCCFVFVQIHYFSVGYRLNCVSSQTLMLKS